jgi:hypothetical protein
MAARRKYLNYTTPWGVDLARVATAGWTPFLIHESGYQPALENWNHQGVDSPFWRFYYNPKPSCQGAQNPAGAQKRRLDPCRHRFRLRRPRARLPPLAALHHEPLRCVLFCRADAFSGR